jgi:uncharacterized membrane protein YhaH (DUF805 family)
MPSSIRLAQYFELPKLNNRWKRVNWYLQVLQKYAIFSGRARRKEYWIFGLIHAVVIYGLKGADLVIERFHPGYILGIVEMLYVFATFIPLLAVSVRRLHDTNRSGWWFLMFLIPIVNLILFFAFMTEDSQPGENRFGPNPKGEVAVVLG